MSMDDSANASGIPIIDDLSLMDLSHEENNLPALELDEVCIIEESLIKPVEAIPAVETEEFTCEKCNFEGKDNAELTKHGETHMPVYNCGKCLDKFKSFEDLAKHMDTLHNPKHKTVDAVALYSCGKCDFTSENLEDLDVHNQNNIHSVKDQSFQEIPDDVPIEGKEAPDDHIDNEKDENPPNAQDPIKNVKKKLK